MNQRWTAFLFLPVFLAAGLPSPAQADRGGFVIREFETGITVQADSDIRVDERLVVEFSEARHGIYRTIPIRYTDPKGFAYSMGFRLLEVLGEDGRPQKTKVTHEGRYVQIRIGDPERTVSGVVTYTIRYRVSDALGHFPGHDELYWNATGHEWDTRIDRALATIHLPAPLPSDSLETAGFTGRFGEREGRAVIDYPAPGAVSYRVSEPLAPMEGLTVVAAWPPGYVRFPDRATRSLRAAGDNWILVVPVLFLGLLGWIYTRRGRDPEGSAAVVVRYEPPQGVTAGEIGTLIDETVDLRDLTAVVIDLAVRGHLVIREEERSTLFSLIKKNETVFERKKDKREDDLLPHEKLILAGMFETGDVVASRNLKEKFYRHLPGIRKALYAHLTRRGCFAGDPRSVRTRYQALGVLAAVATGLVGVLWAQSRGGIFPQAGVVPLVAAIVTLVVFLVLAPAMPRRTRTGVQMRDWAIGFREFVNRVEGPRLEAEEARNAFEALLPFAMALGVASSWARRFEGIYRTQPPTWYVGTHAGQGFSTPDFEHHLSSSMGEVGRQMSVSPRSSSGTGGGGFSGGGGGGGGGGSW